MANSGIPVVSQAAKVVEAVIQNPLPVIATVGLTMAIGPSGLGLASAGAAAPVASALVTYANGGSAEQVFTSAAASYVGGQAAQAAAPAAASAAQTYGGFTAEAAAGIGRVAGQVAEGAVKGTASSLVAGNNIGDALKTGATGGVVNAAVNLGMDKATSALDGVIDRAFTSADSAGSSAPSAAVGRVEPMPAGNVVDATGISTPPVGSVPQQSFGSNISTVGTSLESPAVQDSWFNASNAKRLASYFTKPQKAIADFLTDGAGISNNLAQSAASAGVNTAMNVQGVKAQQTAEQAAMADYEARMAEYQRQLDAWNRAQMSNAPRNTGSDSNKQLDSGYDPINRGADMESFAADLTMYLEGLGTPGQRKERKMRRQQSSGMVDGNAIQTIVGGAYAGNQAGGYDNFADFQYSSNGQKGGQQGGGFYG